MDSDKKNTEEMTLVDADGIEYHLEIYRNDDKIHFKIRENKVYPPFTFENDFTMNDFIEHHKAFRSCVDLDEVLQHFKNLYNNGKLNLYNLGEKEKRVIIANIWDISEEKDTKDFDLYQKMTEKKDIALSDLYNIQKKQVGILKSIKQMIKESLTDENPLKKAITDILEKCRTEI